MEEQQPKTRHIASVILAIVLWLITFGLGLETIYNLKQIYFIVSVMLGGSVEQSTMSALVLVYILGIAYMVFVIVSTEYHSKRVGKPESWRLFGWTIAVEVSILILYYLL